MVIGCTSGMHFEYTIELVKIKAFIERKKKF